MYVLFKKRDDKSEVFWIGEFSPTTGAPRISKDLTKAHVFSSLADASSYATSSGMLDFRVGNRR